MWQWEYWTILSLISPAQLHWFHRQYQCFEVRDRSDTGHLQRGGGHCGAKFYLTRETCHSPTIPLNVQFPFLIQSVLTLWRTQQVYGTPQASGPVPLQKWYWLTPQSLYSSPPQQENWKQNSGKMKPLGPEHAVKTKVQVLSNPTYETTHWVTVSTVPCGWSQNSRTMLPSQDGTTEPSPLSSVLQVRPHKYTALYILAVERRKVTCGFPDMAI